MKNKLFLYINVSLITFAFLGGLAVAAWSNPPGDPPSGNPDSPLTVGSSQQVKKGPLSINLDGTLSPGLVVEKNGIVIKDLDNCATDKKLHTNISGKIQCAVDLDEQTLSRTGDNIVISKTNSAVIAPYSDRSGTLTNGNFSGGSGTNNTIPKWSGTALTDSGFVDDGALISYSRNRSGGSILLVNNNGGGTAIFGGGSTGVEGSSQTGVGVYGRSTTGAGSGTGVQGDTFTGKGVSGWSSNGGIGVSGEAQGSGSKGVYAKNDSSNGYDFYGDGPTSYFKGEVYISDNNSIGNTYRLSVHGKTGTQGAISGSADQGTGISGFSQSGGTGVYGSCNGSGCKGVTASSTTGGTALLVQGTSSFTDDLNINNHNITGVNKLTVNTVDPVYSIGGINYATYMAGMTGVKEETTGVVRLSDNKYVIDFDEEVVGSDLWLFSKASNLRDNFDKLVVILTPSFDGRAWYEKDSINNRLIIYGSSNGEVSYRLTAPRFDSKEWTNYNYDLGVRGLIIND